MLHVTLRGGLRELQPRPDAGIVPCWPSFTPSTRNPAMTKSNSAYFFGKLCDRLAEDLWDHPI